MARRRALRGLSNQRKQDRWRSTKNLYQIIHFYLKSAGQWNVQTVDPLVMPEACQWSRSGASTNDTNHCILCLSTSIRKAPSSAGSMCAAAILRSSPRVNAAAPRKVRGHNERRILPHFARVTSWSISGPCLPVSVVPCCLMRVHDPCAHPLTTPKNHTCAPRVTWIHMCFRVRNGAICSVGQRRARAGHQTCQQADLLPTCRSLRGGPAGLLLPLCRAIMAHHGPRCADMGVHISGGIREPIKSEMGIGRHLPP
jgi:hypothetical protein